MMNIIGDVLKHESLDGTWIVTEILKFHQNGLYQKIRINPIHAEMMICHNASSKEIWQGQAPIGRETINDFEKIKNLVETGQVVVG